MPWAVTAVLFYGIPLVVAWLMEPDILLRKPLGFLHDWNVMCMYLVTLPVIVILSLSQRSMVPERIAGIMRGRAIPVRDKYGSMSEFVGSWNKRFKIVNLLGQLAGIVVAVAVSYANYETATGGYSGWQVTGGYVNVAGWVELCWQLPLFYWITVVYVSQGMALIVLLFRLTRNFEIEVFPFHYDNCSGLRIVGRLGLRNQYLLAVIGLNLLALLAVNVKRGNPRTVPLLVAAAMAYVSLGPLVFLGPLLPFRKRMLSAKQSEQAKVATRFRHEYDRIMDELQSRSMTKEDEELIDRLQKLKVLVNRIPVWPFDTGTLRRFVTAYVLPFLTALVSILINYAITALKGISSTVQQ
jgi:hypothetical protein